VVVLGPDEARKATIARLRDLIGPSVAADAGRDDRSSRPVGALS
jgi:hypothetical protein